MTYKNYSLAFFVIYFFTSCSATKPLVSMVSPNQIKEIGLLPPFSMVKQISESNEMGDGREINEQIETNAATIFDEIAGVAEISYSKVDLSPQSTSIIYGEIFKSLDTLLAYRSQKRKQNYPASGKFGFDENRLLFSSLSISDSSINVLKSFNKRFLAFILTSGRTRTIANAKALRRENGAKNALGLGLGLLTGYGFYSLQNLYFCENHVLILDTDKKNFAYYNLTQSENGDPANPSSLRDNIMKLFTNYWIEKNAETNRYIKK